MPALIALSHGAGIHKFCMIIIIIIIIMTRVPSYHAIGIIWPPHIRPALSEQSSMSWYRMTTTPVDGKQQPSEPTGMNRFL